MRKSLKVNLARELFYYIYGIKTVLQVVLGLTFIHK